MGGYENLLDKYSQSVPDAKYASFKIENGLNVSCSEVRPDFAHLFHSINDDFLPWTGVLSGMVIASIYYWCSDQVSIFFQNQCCQLLISFFFLVKISGNCSKITCCQKYFSCQRWHSGCWFIETFTIFHISATWNGC